MTNVLASSIHFSSKDVTTRRSANYHPSVWGDYFLTHATEYQTIDVDVGQRHQELKEEVRKMLVAAGGIPSHQLHLIDEIQRLGVAYHFEYEIEGSLKREFDNSHQLEQYEIANDIYTMALSFRLLRDQGHNISSDVFGKLKDSKGNFKESITRDVKGLLSLYEAAHMKARGEDILDEVLEFTITHLKAIEPELSQPLAAQVAHCLNQPIRKSLSRVEARRYIPIYEVDTSCNQILFDFAKLDFNVLQKQHQIELTDISKWWKELNFVEKLPFARDRMVECYFWILGLYFEPQHLFARKFMTKVLVLITAIDDIYDVYATFEELVLFTDAIERWDMYALDQLPEYMRVCYGALLGVYCETEQELANHGISYRIDYAKETMQRLIKAYMEEAKWVHQGYVPTMDEYMKVALVSAANMMLPIHMFVGMRDETITKNTFEWLMSDPPIVKASALITRLTDDIVGHEFEKEHGKAASAVECYMKQYGVTKQQACDVLKKQIEDAWMDMDEGGILSPTIPRTLVTRILNLPRVMCLLYKDKNAFTDSRTKTKHLITSILVDPVVI